MREEYFFTSYSLYMINMKRMRVFGGLVAACAALSATPVLPADSLVQAVVPADSATILTVTDSLVVDSLVINI